MPKAPSSVMDDKGGGGTEGRSKVNPGAVTSNFADTSSSMDPEHEPVNVDEHQSHIATAVYRGLEWTIRRIRRRESLTF
jgi:hypothetical protein